MRGLALRARALMIFAVAPVFVSLFDILNRYASSRHRELDFDADLTPTSTPTRARARLGRNLDLDLNLANCLAAGSDASLFIYWPILCC